MSLFRLHSANHLAHEGRLREVDPKAGARTVPAGGVTTRSRAVSGISLLALQTRARGARWTGTGEGGERPQKLRRFCPRNGDVTGSALTPRPRKHGLKSHLGMEHSLGQNRQWNADRRARPQRRVGASRHFRGAPRTRWCGQFHLRLSAFRFLRFLLFFHHCERSERCIRPRDSGGGGPCEAWWRGRRTQRHSFDDSVATSPAPLPPSCGARWSAFPASAGQEKASVAV
jgi:hypothetical protein